MKSTCDNGSKSILFIKIIFHTIWEIIFSCQNLNRKSRLAVMSLHTVKIKLQPAASNLKKPRASLKNVSLVLSKENEDS